MKNKLFFLLCCLMSYHIVIANDNVQAQINLEHVGKKGNHTEYYIRAEQPDVYYDDEGQVIVVDGGGEVAYYDVGIMAQSTADVVISQTVDGYYDTIDVSSLASDTYTITFTTPTGNTYEGTFNIN